MAAFQIRARVLVLWACVFFAAMSFSVAQGERWEATLSPMVPESFPEFRPLRVQYNFGWSGIAAAKGDVRVANLPGGRVQFDATGGTIGLARTLWSYDLRHTGFCDGQTFRPIKVSEVEDTRAKHVQTELAFSPEGVISVREERKGDAVNSKTRRFDFPNLLSLNSALLFLRTQPMTPGAVHRVVVYPATSAYLCTITVLRPERINVPTGTYEALKLDVQLSRIGKDRQLVPYTKFRKATAWLSNDADRLLLRVEAQIFIGKVFAEIRSVDFDPPKP